RAGAGRCRGARSAALCRRAQGAALVRRGGRRLLLGVVAWSARSEGTAGEYPVLENADRGGRIVGAVPRRTPVRAERLREVEPGEGGAVAAACRLRDSCLCGSDAG